MKSRKSHRPDDPRQERHEGPDMARMVADYRTAVTLRTGNWWDRQKINYEARCCVWPGQSWDGRKWRGRDGKAPFPWRGASDARVPLVDLYIREDVAMLMQAWVQQRIMVRPTKPAHEAGWANKVTALLRWLVYEEMDETEDEAELLANIYLERGAAAVGVWWHLEEQRIRETVSMEDLAAQAQRAQQALQQGTASPDLALMAALPAAIADPSREQEVAAVVMAAIGDVAALTQARAVRLVRELRTQGVATFPRSVVTIDRPTIRAMAWNEDIIVPPECTTRLQRARAVWVRELLTETDLVTRAASYGYDKGWVDQVIETQRGRVDAQLQNPVRRRSASNGLDDLEYGNLFEIVTAYRRLYDEDDIPGMYCTTFSPGLCAAYGEDDVPIGKHELFDYAHGQYPIVPVTLERRSRIIDESRGYGERAFTWQQAIKRQIDARMDRADVATLPPSHHPPDEEPDAWGPGIKIPTNQREKFGYFDIPKHDIGSKEVEQTVQMLADRYFGRQNPETASMEGANLRRELVRGWMRCWKLVLTQTLQLSQQYLPDEVWVRVVGGDQGRSLRVSREEIQGPFNIVLRFNADDIDREFVDAKMALLERALQFDVSGRIDRDEALIAALELIDPSYAERLIKPGDDASLAQIEDERNVLAKALLGMGTDVRGDEAFGLRRQVLEASIRESPTVQAILQNNPQARELVSRRIQQLDFNVQQRTVNPEIGRRLGSQPMGAPADMSAAQASS